MKHVKKLEPLDPVEIIPGYIPADVTILVGEKGAGKSQLAALMAACITDGLPFLSNVKAAKRGKVVLFNGERGIETTVVPRLIAAGVENPAQNVLLPKASTMKEIVQELTNAMIQYRNIAYVIVDPLGAYLDGMNPTNSKARKLMKPLLDLCNQHGIGVLFVTHFTKAGEISGSAGWTQAACSIWRCARIKDGGILEHTVCNVLDTTGQCYEYAIETVTLDPEKYRKRTKPTSRVVITGKSEIDFDTAWKEGKDVSSTMPHRCAQAIEQFLRDGPQDRNVVLSYLQEQGLSERHTFKRAQELLQGRLEYIDKGRSTIWALQTPPTTETEESWHD